MESADTLMEEQKLMAEAKYRQYMTNIDKALRNFEYSSEWADLIAALGKLSKVCHHLNCLVFTIIFAFINHCVKCLTHKPVASINPQCC